MGSTPETPMDKGEKPNQNQKSREEERRVTTVVKDNNSSNEEKTEKEHSAAAASDGLQIVPPPEDRGQLPLQPVLPWEMLVDQMAESESYMESMAMHSCMGKLFVERQEEVIAAFKEHIRRFGREDGLLFLRDVKLYFGNYLSPGGRPAQELKKRLLGSCRQSAEEELYRFEQLIGGQRTYLGHPIPKDAPQDRTGLPCGMKCIGSGKLAPDFSDIRLRERCLSARCSFMLGSVLIHAQLAAYQCSARCPSVFSSVPIDA